MPASQLKRLRASLQEQGAVGPRPTKKRKNRDGKGASPYRDRDVTSVRDQLNPFDVKRNPRAPKHDIALAQPADRHAVKGRPGASRAAGEEKRRSSLLVEMRQRNKVGGIIDRRFGEHDPQLSLDDKMLQRFASEKLRLFKKRTVFDLDNDGPRDESTGSLPKLLNGDDGENEPSMNLQTASIDAVERTSVSKRSRGDIMKELIAKSRLYKHERQVDKETIEASRGEMDSRFSAELLDLIKAVNGRTRQGPTSEAEHLKDRQHKGTQLERSLLAQDHGRAEPAAKAQDDEISAEKRKFLAATLEESKQRRMKGQRVSDEEDRGLEEAMKGADPAILTQGEDHHNDFGLGSGNKTDLNTAEAGLEDEDCFEIDADLVGNESEMESIVFEEEDDKAGRVKENLGGSPGQERESGHQDDGFEDDHLHYGASVPGSTPSDSLPCPQSHTELLSLLAGAPRDSLPYLIRAIREQYHPRLAQGNHERLGKFSRVLMRHVGFLGVNHPVNPPLTLVDLIMRHAHSLAKARPEILATELRIYIESLLAEQPIALTIGDLAILTAIGVLYPTSDHVHQVVTPATLVLMRFLARKIPQCLADRATSTFAASLVFQYQVDSKRYMPEVVEFCFDMLCSLAPVPLPSRKALPAAYEDPTGTRIRHSKHAKIRKLKFVDCSSGQGSAEVDTAVLKCSLLNAALGLTAKISDLWHDKPAYIEIFSPIQSVLGHLSAESCTQHLPDQLIARLHTTIRCIAEYLSASRHARKPLQLHRHKPRAIKTHVPKFEDVFNPEKHYDPNQERTGALKMAKTYRRERKGAIRELRKDAHFVARQKLESQLLRDAAYNKKFKWMAARVREDGQE